MSRAIVFNGTNQRGFVVIPNSAPFSSVSKLEVIGRLRNHRVQSANQRLFWLGDHFNAYFNGASGAGRLTIDFPGNTLDISLGSSLSDMGFRFLWDGGSGIASLEVWATGGSLVGSDSQTGTTGSRNVGNGDGLGIASNNYNNGANLQAKFDWLGFKFNGTNTAFNAAQPTEADVAACTLKYHFEDNGNDSGANGLHLTLDNDQSFEDTPTSGGGGGGGTGALDPLAATSAALGFYVTRDSLAALAENDPVTAWPDETANNNDLAEASAPPTLKTIGGQRAVYFDGANSIGKLNPVNCASVGNANFTYFIVLRRSVNVATDKCPLHVGNNFAGRSLYLKGTNAGVDASKPYINRVGFEAEPQGETAIVLDETTILTLVRDGDDWKWRSNGFAANTGNSAGGFFDGADNASIVLGGRGSYNPDIGVADRFTGYILAAGMFIGAVSDNEIARIEEFLGAAFGVTVGQAPPPTADAGADHRGAKAGSVITLDGTSSVGNGGATITGYAWSQTGGAAVTLSNANVAQPTFTAPNTGQYHDLTFQLVVTDSNGGTASDTTHVFIVPCDENDVLTAVPPDGTRLIVGPQLRHGSPLNPYPWFDENAVTMGLLHGAAYPATRAGLTSDELGRIRGFWNYYDQAKVQLENYFRTGDPVFLGFFRKITDMYAGEFDPAKAGDGYEIAPREAALLGLIGRAIDEDRIAGVAGASSKWHVIKKYTEWHYNNWVYIRKDYPGLYYGIRDGAYATMFAAVLCQVLPDSYPDPDAPGGTATGGAAFRATLKAQVEEGVDDYYLNLQHADGSWRWTNFDGSLHIDNWINPDWYPGNENIGHGEQSFMLGLLVEALRYVHDLTSDTGLKSRIANAVIKVTDHVWDALYRVDDDVTDVAGVKWRSMLYSIFHGYHPGYALGSPPSSIVGSLSAGATTIPVIATGPVPAAGYGVIQGATVEFFHYTDKTPNSFIGVTRGIGGTAAVAHDHGDIIEIVYNPTTTLTQAVDADDQTLIVGDSSVLSNNEGVFALIGSEIVNAKTVVGNNLNLSLRGAQQTMAAAHPAGAVVVDLTRIFSALTAPLSESATTANVLHTTGMPDAGFIKIGLEEMEYTAKTSETVTGLVRGARGSVAAAHPLGSLIRGQSFTPLLTPRVKGDSPTVQIGDAQVTNIRDGRQLNATMCVMFGVAYEMSGGAPRFKERGDEVFDATFGKTGGTRVGGPDGFYGLADYTADNDRRAKEYDENYRAAGYYLAQRLLEAGGEPDTTAPIVLSASVPAGGDRVVLVMSEAVTPGSPTGFSVKVGGVNRAVTSASVAGSSITLMLASVVYASENVTDSYAPGNVTDIAGNALAAFTNQPVTNNSTQTPTTNLPPVCALVSPVAGSVVPLGDAITLMATASDSDGSVVKVEFYDGSMKVGEDTSAPYSISYMDAPAGQRTLTARAYDDDGAFTNSTPIVVLVKAPPPPPTHVIATAGDNRVTLTWE